MLVWIGTKIAYVLLMFIVFCLVPDMPGDNNKKVG